MSYLPKYYCLLCETTHSELKPSIKCPNCGRIFCQDSIRQSFSVGLTSCPYCDESFEGIKNSNQMSIQVKKQKQTFSTFNKFKKIPLESTKQEKLDNRVYILIVCMVLPFLVIIGLMFLRVFLMFFEIFSI